MDFVLYSLRAVDEAHRSFAHFMKSLISSKKAEIQAETSTEAPTKNDLFTCLIRASEKEGKTGLSDDELVGFRYIR